MDNAFILMIAAEAYISESYMIHNSLILLSKCINTYRYNYRSPIFLYKRRELLYKEMLYKVYCYIKALEEGYRPIS